MVPQNPLENPMLGQVAWSLQQMSFVNYNNDDEKIKLHKELTPNAK